MSSTHLFVALNRPAFYPGKPVDGVVILYVVEPVTVRSFTLEWKGVELVSWFQGVTQKDLCRGTYDIFADEVVLAGGIDGDIMMEPGTYTYPIEWMLPENLPASYEEAKQSGGVFQNFAIPENGIIPKSFGDEKSYIRYFCSAKLDIVVQELNPEGEVVEKILKTERPVYFKVVEAFDPSILVQEPKRAEVTKSFMLSGDPVEVMVSVANGGVLFTGQNLFFHIHVTNGSTRRVERILMRLEEHIKFMVEDSKAEQTFHRKETALFARVDDSLVRSKEVFERDLMMPIPTLITGTLGCAKHILREYELIIDVEMQISGKVTVSIPIHLLQWTPLIKDEVPDVVPIKISKRKDTEIDTIQNITEDTTSDNEKAQLVDAEDESMSVSLSD